LKFFHSRLTEEAAMITRSRGYFSSALAMVAALGFVVVTSTAADARPGYRGGGGGYARGGAVRGGAVYRGGAYRGGYAYRGGGYRGGYYGGGGWGWGAPAVGAAVGLGVLGAAAAAAAASSTYCRVPVYDSWGNVVGYRNAYCN
jgi:hypothetical protein